jgi:hypothetical protein
LRGILQREMCRDCSCQYSDHLCKGIDGVYSCYSYGIICPILYCITLPYSILFFCGFLFFLPYTNTDIGGTWIVLSARIGGRGRKCVSEASMENACGINSIMKRGMLHAPKERKRISKVQDSLVFQISTYPSFRWTIPWSEWPKSRSESLSARGHLTEQFLWVMFHTFKGYKTSPLDFHSS